MVRIRTNDIFITNDDKIVFGDNFDSEIFWDSSVPYPTTSGDLRLTTTISGVDPTESYHLTTKNYVDYEVGLIYQAGGYIFGSNAYYAKDETESSTNSVIYIEKLNLTASGVPAGDYRIGFSWEWRHSKSNQFFWGRVQLDDTTTIYEFSSSPIVDVNTWRLVTGFDYITLSSGTHYVDIDYRSSSAGSTSYIGNVKIEFWRAN